MEKASVIETLNGSNNEKYVTPFTLAKKLSGGGEKYPIGSLYLSVNDTNPSILFGGTWVQIKGQYLLTVDTETTMQHNAPMKSFGEWYSKGTTLTINQIPYHDHISRNYSKNYNAGTSIPSGKSYSISYGTGTGMWAYNGTSSAITGGEINETANTTGTGGNQAHDHQVIPPSFTVYAWYRVS